MFNLNKRIIRQALDLSPVATIIVDLKTHPKPVVFVNQAFEALSGYDAGELIGHPWSELLVDTGEDGELQPGDTARLGCHPRLGVAEELCLDMLPLYDQPGTPRYWLGTERQLNAAAEGDSDSERDALLSVLRDARMHLRRLDGRDSTTGILNRRAFDDLLQRDWMMARREKRTLTAMIFRIDAFAAYREVFGRHAADSCLAKVAHAITGSLRRAGDLTARYTDDQFVVLIGNADEPNSRMMADKIAAKVHELTIHHPRSPVDRYVTLSYGLVNSVPSASQSPQEFLDEAAANLPSEGSSDMGFGKL